MILRIRDSDGNVQEILVLKGEKGENGDAYILTAADKQEVAEIVLGRLKTETWTFTLENGSTVTKTVVLK